jgi:hypothetical protein
MPGQFINTGTNPFGKVSLINNNNSGNLVFSIGSGGGGGGNGTNGIYGLILDIDATTNGNTGTTIPNTSGYSGMDFTAVNTSYPWIGAATPYYRWAGGAYGVSIENSNTYLNELTSINSMTIAAWIYFPGSVPNITSIVARGNNGWALRVGANGNTLNLVKYNIADQYASLNTSLQPNTWYHIAAIQGGSILKYMVNGQEVYTTDTANTSNFPGNLGNLFLFHDPYIGGNNEGRLGKISIWDQCVSSSTITAQFNSTKAAYGY